MNKFIILAFAGLILASYKQRKVKQINVDFKPEIYKLTKMDAG